jgi:phenylacetate-coenzyme A ligase PaaK-like adenylate-forming protein
MFDREAEMISKGASASRRWASTAYRKYSAPGVAAECHVAQNGLHRWEDHFLLEVVDVERLAPVPMEEAGELVITTLTKEALPMVRYRTRDITRLSDGPCACGRTHVRIMRVTGRNDDMLIILGVNLCRKSRPCLSAPRAWPRTIRSRSRETLDAMTVEVERRPQCVRRWGGTREARGGRAASPHVDDRRDLRGPRQGAGRVAAITRQGDAGEG